jgi:hypothetical protein
VRGRLAIILTLAILTAALTANAQPPPKVYRIGVLGKRTTLRGKASGMGCATSAMSRAAT